MIADHKMVAAKFMFLLLSPVLVAMTIKQQLIIIVKTTLPEASIILTIFKMSLSLTT